MSDYAKDVLVDTQWVEDHLNDDTIRIVEVDRTALYAKRTSPARSAWTGSATFRTRLRNRSS